MEDSSSSTDRYRQKLAERVKQHHLDTRAMHLIDRGFRTSIVQIETGLKANRVRELAHGLAGLAGDSVRLPSGALPSAECILETRAAAIEGTLFILLYKNHAGIENARLHIDIDAIVAAHTFLTEQRSKFGAALLSQPLDINHCWVLARDFRAPLPKIPPALDLRRCTDCGMPHLTVSVKPRLSACPFCVPNTAPGDVTTTNTGANTATLRS